jgi:hypothetical protein
MSHVEPAEHRMVQSPPGHSIGQDATPPLESVQVPVGHASDERAAEQVQLAPRSQVKGWPTVPAPPPPVWPDEPPEPPAGATSQS